MATDESNNQTGQSVGDKIRATRRAMKLTQRELAGTDFSVSYISAIERGHIQPSLRALAILAGRLGISTTQLFVDQATDGIVPNYAMHRQPSRQEMIELGFLEAQVSLVQGMSLQAIEQLEQIATKQLKRRQQVQLQYLLGWAYLQAEQFEKSKNTLLEAARLAKDPGDFLLNVRIQTMLGNVFMATHDDTEALGAYQLGVDLLASDQQCNPFLTLQVYTNLGECAIRLNQLEQAGEIFQRAAALAEKLATIEQLKVVYGQLFQQYGKAGEYELADLQAEKCVYLYDQEARLRTRGELYYRLCHAVMQGDQEQARVFLDEALEREGGGEDGLSMASITLHLGAWFLAHDEIVEAKAYAQEALEGARPFGETVIAAEAALLMGQVTFRESRYEEGDGCFAEGLAMLERLGLGEELAEGLVLYAGLLEDAGRPEEALRYWRRAVGMKRG